MSEETFFHKKTRQFAERLDQDPDFLVDLGAESFYGIKNTEIGISINLHHISFFEPTLDGTRHYSFDEVLEKAPQSVVNKILFNIDLFT